MQTFCIEIYNIKNNIKFSLLIIAAALIAACNSSTEKQKISESGETHEAITQHVSLNNGEKWKANPETDSGIATMKELVNRFTGNENINAYHDLRTGLEKEFNTIIEKCSMKGEAHEQLHNYLLPMRPVFDSLSSDKIETCKTAFTQIKNHLAKYSDYFE